MQVHSAGPGLPQASGSDLMQAAGSDPVPVPGLSSGRRPAGCQGPESGPDSGLTQAAGSDHPALGPVSVRRPAGHPAAGYHLQ